jgi:hypothetical protein
MSKNAELWIKKTVKNICNEFNVSAKVVIGDHSKIYFTNFNGETCMCVLSKTSGDKNVRHIEIGRIRRELRNKLGVDVKRDFFTLSYAPCFRSKFN